MKIPKVFRAGRTKARVAAPPPGKIVPMSLDKSDVDRWCWASVSAGLQVLYKDTYPETQCQVASRVFEKKRDCCANKKSCDEDKLLSAALNHHYKGREHDSKLRTLEFVKKEIDAGRVVPIRLWKGSGTAGHYVVICGYALPPDGRRLLYVWDPQFADVKPREESEAGLKTSYPKGKTWRWHYSYLTK